MFRKIYAAVIIFSLFAPMLCLGLAMPPEVKTFTLKFFKEMAAAQQSLSKSVNSATSPDKIAAALNTYNDAIEPLINSQVALEAKYPEYYASFNRMDDEVSSGDAEVDAAQKKFDESQESFETTAMAKIMLNHTKPEVSNAMERMQQIMGRMDSGMGGDSEQGEE